MFAVKVRSLKFIRRFCIEGISTLVGTFCVVLFIHT